MAGLANAEVFFNIRAFLDSKRDLDNVAETILASSLMNSLSSFQHPSLSIQPNYSAPEPLTLDALYAVGATTLPVMEALCMHLANECALDPSEIVTYGEDKAPVLIDEKNAFTRVTIAAMKGRDRAEEKLREEYDLDASKMVDMVRASIVVDTEDQLKAICDAIESNGTKLPLPRQLLKDLSGRRESEIALDTFADQFTRYASGKSYAEVKEGGCPNYVVARFKNRFAKPLYNGYRDTLWSLRVEVPGASESDPPVWHVCELQVHLAAVVALKHRSHDLYAYFRTFFAGNLSAVDERMVFLAELEEGASYTTLEESISATVASGSVSKLSSLASLLELMGEYALEAEVQEAQIAVSPKPEILEVELAQTLTRAVEFRRAEGVARKAHAALSASPDYGEDHETTLKCAGILANIMTLLGDYAEASAMYTQSTELWEAMHGLDNREAVETMSLHALCCEKMGALDVAGPLYERVIEWRTANLGASHADTLSTCGNHATLLQKESKIPEAEKLARHAHGLAVSGFGLGHAITKLLATVLAGILFETGEEDEAMQLYLSLDN
jgi:tetratricopeptide (TPR) repeat protein